MILHRLTVLLTFLFLSFEVDVSAYDLQRLFINVEGGNLSIVNAWDINDSGKIVGFYFQSPSGRHGFIYDLEEKTTTIFNVPGAQTSAFGNNDSGDIVGSYTIGGVNYGFLYDGLFFTTLIAKQVDDFILDTSAHDINNSRVIVGVSPLAFEGTGGFTYSGGVFTPLYGPAGESASPWGINDSGEIVGCYVDDDSETHGFIKSDAGYTTLDYPGAAFGTCALSINNSGVVVGVYYVEHAADEHGFIWEEGVFSELDFEGASKSKPTGINNSNDVVGTRSTTFSYYGLGEPSPTFIWTGEAGDNDWHKALNWDDKETGEDVEEAPGLKEGTESVEIVQSAVTLAGFPAHIRSIEAGGSLVVNQPLTLEENSTIENLTLGADLSNGGMLRLSGDNAWNNGILSGNGSINIQETDSTLIINSDVGILGLETKLSIGGRVTQTVGTLNLSTGGIVEAKGSNEYTFGPRDDGGHGSITVNKDGVYELQGGSIITGDESAKLSLKNGSLLHITGSGGLFDPLETKIDIPLETSGKTKILLGKNAVLEISKTGNFNQANEDDTNLFEFDSEGQLNFTAPQIFNVRTEFNYIGTRANMVISTSDSLIIRNDTSIARGLKFELGGDLDVTQGRLLFDVVTRIEWQKGHITGNGITNKGVFLMAWIQLTSARG